MMTISRHEAGKLRNIGSITGISKTILSLESYMPRSGASQGVQEEYSFAVKRSGRDVVVWTPV